MNNQQILDNAPDGATHFHPNFKKYYKFTECVNTAEMYLMGGWEHYPVYPSIRSLADIKRIAELEKTNTKLGMKSTVLDLAKGHLTQCEAALVERDRRITELENCLRQYLDATQPIYSNSGELSVVEYKASCLLEQSE